MEGVSGQWKSLFYCWRTAKSVVLAWLRWERREVLGLACVASFSSRGLSRKLEREQKKNEWPFFCFRSNFRAITRLETLATQAILGRVIFVPRDVAIFSCRPHPLLPREGNLHVKKSDRLFHESARNYRKFLSSLELQSPQLKKTPCFTSQMRALQFLIYCCCCHYFYYCHY